MKPLDYRPQLNNTVVLIKTNSETVLVSNVDGKRKRAQRR